MSRQHEANGSQRKKEVCAILTHIRETDYERSTSAPLHAQSGAIVASLAECLDVTPQAPYPRYAFILAGIIAGLPIALLGFLIGAFWQDRGWAALLVFAVVLAAVTIRERNAR